MRFIIISKVFLFLLALSLSVISTDLNVSFADDSLDGKTFIIELSENDKNNKTKDELIFKDGTFFSSDCEQYGFGSAPYETKPKGDTILFESTLTSEKEGKSEWEGKIEGDQITGTFIWSKEGQKPMIYTYQGSIKK